uniref:Uncharacterized protein n=1 Tax=Avena sativa TaxID=4498 RepID=A0ACD5XLT5_AVESA
MAPETVNMDLDLDEDGEYYGRFIVKLRKKLAHHPQGRYIAKHPWLEGHPLLPVQKHPRQPSRWVHINVVARDKETSSKAMRTTLAVRDDNVYLIGFKNGEGKWYEFGLENQSMRFIEGSTFLGCDVGYGDLANLHHVGKYPAIDAVRRLSGYGGVGGAAADDDDDTADTIRRDLALMCVMICESARMMPHFNTVAQGWDGTELGAQHAEYIKTWSSMSRRLLSMQDPSPERNHLLTVFHLLLNSPDPNPMRVGKSVLGRPLLEVFHVRIFGPIDTIGTIAVFDGKRGQIIYNHTQGTTSGPLTGPYRAISAEGSVMIQVHGIISGTESRDVIAEIMLWNCYADGVDKALERHINTATYNGTRLPLAEVKYAVWSDAVEATMEVSLLLPAITSVHGTITAFCGSPSANEVVLFSRQEGDKVELVPSVANSMVPLELGRSVVVVPLLNRYQCLRIYMTLRAQTPNNGSDVRPLQGYYFFHLHESTGKIQFHYGSDFFVPVGWTGLSSNDVSASASRQTATRQSGKQQIKVQVKITSPGFHVSHPKIDSQQHMNMYR